MTGQARRAEQISRFRAGTARQRIAGANKITVAASKLIHKFKNSVAKVT